MLPFLHLAISMVSCYRPQGRILGVGAALCDHLVRLSVVMLQKSRHKATVVRVMAEENRTSTTMISERFSQYGWNKSCGAIGELPLC